jgi:hypothetical protein
MNLVITFGTCAESMLYSSASGNPDNVIGDMNEGANLRAPRDQLKRINGALSRASRA